MLVFRPRIPFHVLGHPVRVLIGHFSVLMVVPISFEPSAGVEIFPNRVQP